METKKALIAGGIALGLAIGGLIVKKTFYEVMPCDVTLNHTHKYTNSHGYSKYVDSHYNRSGLYKYSDEIGPISKEIIDAEKQGFLSVELNKEILLHELDGQNNYVEYQYEYDNYEQTGSIPIPHTSTTTDSKGRTTTSTYYTYMPIYGWVHRKSWTNDTDLPTNYRTNFSYTEQARDVTKVCTMYNYDEDQKEKSRFIKSDWVFVDDVFRYQYFKPGYIREERGAPYYTDLFRRSNSVKQYEQK